MKNLQVLYDKNICDKNERIVENNKVIKSGHNYLPLYDELLLRKQKDATKVLEVGVLKGGSIKLFYDYFDKAEIYGLEIEDGSMVIEKIKHNPRIKLFFSVNAYDKTIVDNLFSKKNIKFDFILDDGEHSLESMKKFIDIYLPLLKDNGILIIEDIKNLQWVAELKNHTPNAFKNYIKTFDLRNYEKADDIVFVIDKNPL